MLREENDVSDQDQDRNSEANSPYYPEQQPYRPRPRESWPVNDTQATPGAQEIPSASQRSQQEDWPFVTHQSAMPDSFGAFPPGQESGAPGTGVAGAAPMGWEQ